MNKPFVITIVGAESSGKTTLAMRLAEYFACPWVPEYAREYLEGLGRPYNERDLEIISEGQLEEINRQLAISNKQKTIGNQQLATSNRQLANDNMQYAIGNKQLAIGKKQSKESGQPIYLKDVVNHINSLLVTRYSSILVLDGGMMNLRLWARIKYKSKIQIVEDTLKDDVTDLYLLCRPLNEWEPDPMREAPSIIDRVWIYNQYLKELASSSARFEIVDSTENEKQERALQIISKL
ncbi:MAG: ATP-binding protein [Saprospiraceae bacterium]